MDAERLEFPAASFDVVVAQCVVNTVPNPGVALDEFARVVKSGGEIVLLNRMGADAGPRRVFEPLFQPVAKVGWRSEFPWGRFARWAASTPHGIHLIERRPMPPLGHFSLIRFGKAAPALVPTGSQWYPAGSYPTDNLGAFESRACPAVSRTRASPPSRRDES